MVGTKLDGLVSICDYYSTFACVAPCSAGPRAAAAAAVSANTPARATNDHHASVCTAVVGFCHSFLPLCLILSFLSLRCPAPPRPANPRYLAGVDPTDHRAAAKGLPPIDSLNMVPYFLGKQKASPRTDLYADHKVLIKGQFKLLVGTGTNPDDAPCPGGAAACVGSACWASPHYPNISIQAFCPHGPAGAAADTAADRAAWEATERGPAKPGWRCTDCTTLQVCAKGGCLYNIFEDPEERNELSSDPKHASVLADMITTLAAYRVGSFLPKRTGGNPELAYEVGVSKYGGFWGPFIFNASQRVIA